MQQIHLASPPPLKPTPSICRTALSTETVSGLIGRIVWVQLELRVPFSSGSSSSIPFRACDRLIETISRYRWGGEDSRLARDDGHQMRMDDVEAAVLIAAGAAPAANRAEKVL